MIIMKLQVSGWTVEVSRQAGGSGMTRVSAFGTIRGGLRFLADPTSPLTARAASSSNSGVTTRFEPSTASGVNLYFLSQEPANGGLGSLAIDGPAAHWSGKPDDAVLRCDVFAPNLVDSIVRRHEVGGTVLEEVHIDVDGLEEEPSTSGTTPVLLWDRVARAQLVVMGIHASGFWNG